MSPAPSTENQRTAREIAGQLYNYLRCKSCELFSVPFDVRLTELNEGHKSIITGQNQYPDQVKIGIFEDLEIDLDLVFKGQDQVKIL